MQSEIEPRNRKLSKIKEISTNPQNNKVDQETYQVIAINGDVYK